MITLLTFSQTIQYHQQQSFLQLHHSSESLHSHNSYATSTTCCVPCLQLGTIGSRYTLSLIISGLCSSWVLAA
eukprot:6187939-Pleurochrysis_carterae.AAC.3